MKLITPFTILNQNFHEIDLIRDAMKNRKLAKERLHDDYRNRKMYKYHQFAQITKKNHVPVENPTFNNSLMVLLQV